VRNICPKTKKLRKIEESRTERTEKEAYATLPEQERGRQYQKYNSNSVKPKRNTGLLLHRVESRKHRQKKRKTGKKVD